MVVSLIMDHAFEVYYVKVLVYLYDPAMGLNSGKVLPDMLI
jgi:hypothetical protein